MRRGLTQNFVYIYAPHPIITDKELLSMATLDLAEPSTVPPFQYQWKYSYGDECEWLIINPKTFTAIREEEATWFLKEAGELGFVIVKDPNNGAEVRKESIKGLQAALKYWRERGARKIADFRKMRGLSKEDMEDYKYDYHPYYIAEAKGRVIEKELRRVQNSEPRKSVVAPQKGKVANA